MSESRFEEISEKMCDEIEVFFFFYLFLFFFPFINILLFKSVIIFLRIMKIIYSIGTRISKSKLKAIYSKSFVLIIRNNVVQKTTSDRNVCLAKSNGILFVAEMGIVMEMEQAKAPGIVNAIVDTREKYAINVP